MLFLFLEFMSDKRVPYRLIDIHFKKQDFFSILLFSCGWETACPSFCITSCSYLHLEDWSNENIQLWANLKAKYGLRYAFTIYGNDTPENQLLILQNWKKRGVEFDFFEMMNECWQTRYSKPDHSKPDVLFQVTSKMYIEEILARFFAVLDVLKVPYHLICSPANAGQ